MTNKNSQIRQLSSYSGILYFAAEYPISVHGVATELTDYDFLIALTAIKSLRYRNLFKENRRPDRYRIVDSGVFEDPSNPPSLEKLCEIALDFDADEVVALDAIGDCQQTLELTRKFLELSDSFPFKVMAVPQGKDFSEWLTCYDEFVEDPRVDVIGVTYHKHPAGLETIGIANFGIPNRYEAARLCMIHMLAARGSVRKPIHILGLGHCRAIKYYRQFSFVRSIDTSFPVQLGVEGRPLWLDAPKSKFKVNFGAELVRAEKALIAENLLRFLNLCHGRDEEDLWEAVGRLSSMR